MPLRSIIRPGQTRNITALALALLVAPASPAPLAAQNHWRVAADKSTFRIELGRAGWLKAFGDDHLIDVTGYECRLDFDPAAPAAASVELTIPAKGLRVLDPQLSAEKRAEVQQKMEGPEVLDLARFAAIRFVSRRVTPEGSGRFRVEGDLQIRNSTRSVTLQLNLTQESGAYRARGEAAVRLTWFGIQPPSAGGGSVKVKDEMKIVFDLLLVAKSQEDGSGSLVASSIHSRTPH